MEARLKPENKSVIATRGRLCLLRKCVRVEGIAQQMNVSIFRRVDSPLCTSLFHYGEISLMDCGWSSFRSSLVFGEYLTSQADIRSTLAKAKSAPTFSSALLKDEGRAFPRGGGGGSSLTPVERKQLQVHAARDALLDSTKPFGSKQAHSSHRNSLENATPDNKPQAKKNNHHALKKGKAVANEHDEPAEPLGLTDLSPGMITVGRVTKVEDYAVFVQLGTELAGRIGLTELEDDYDQANPHKHIKHEKLRVCVLGVDVPNKKTVLTTRPSKVLSSALPVKDPVISKISSLRQDQLVRGFVKNVAEIGLFVSLSHSVTAFVRVAELSDDFLEDWRSNFQIDQLVTGRIVALDESARRVQMSLKASVIAKGYKRPTTFIDLHEGDIVKGTIRKVEAYGAFVVVDNSDNVSGLCHRSEMAEARVDNVHALYSEGDRVKAKVLSLDIEKRKISFGLKASYFTAASESSDSEAEDEESSEKDEGINITNMDDLSESVAIPTIPSEPMDSDQDEGTSSLEESDSEADDEQRTEAGQAPGLDAGDFDWNPQTSKSTEETSTDETTMEEPTKKKKSHKPKILEDHTNDLDTYGPRSTGDYERLLLGQRDDASLWVQYMAFHLDRQDVDASRVVAERALREIGITRQAEKLDVWTAWLNLELKVGTEDTVEDVFKKACEVTDRHALHERMSNCYIGAGWYKVCHDTPSIHDLLANKPHIESR